MAVGVHPRTSCGEERLKQLPQGLVEIIAESKFSDSLAIIIRR